MGSEMCIRDSGPRVLGFQGGRPGWIYMFFRGVKNPREKKFKLLGENWDRIFEKTRVGFGRTELSLRLSCTELCALSSGHGPRGKGFQGGPSGVDFHVFQGGSKIRETNSLNFSKKRSP